MRRTLELLSKRQDPNKVQKAGLAFSLFVAAPRAALACAVCFGQSDSPMAKATNMGIFLMLGVVAVVLGSFASFFVYLSRQARLAAGASDEPGQAQTPAGAQARRI